MANGMGSSWSSKALSVVKLINSNSHCRMATNLMVSGIKSTELLMILAITTKKSMKVFRLMAGTTNELKSLSTWNLTEKPNGNSLLAMEKWTLR